MRRFQAVTEAQRLGREPFFYVEIDLDFCANTFGVLPCTATDIAGFECYNTFATCKDRPNFDNATPKTYRFTPLNQSGIITLESFPAIQGNPQITPVRLEVEQGIGQRGALTIKLQDFTHNDKGIDPYYSTRIIKNSGSFFNKLRRRNPFYVNREIRLITGYILNGSLVETIERLYLINSFDGADSKGQFKINAKDILKLADDNEAVAPAKLDIMTAGAITSSQPTVTLRTGDGAKVPATGLFRVDEEIFYYGTVTGDVLTVARGQFGSIAVAHDANKAAILCLRHLVANVVNIIYELLTIYAGIDPKYIPFNNEWWNPDEWDDEKANWLINNDLTVLINEPTKVNELLSQICEQNGISLWWNEKEQKIKLSGSSVALANKIPASINNENNVIADSFSMVEDIDNRVSQIWIYYAPKNYGLDMSDADNYQSLKIWINETYETPDAYGTPRIKRIYAWWLSSINDSIVATIASRLITKDLTQTFKINFNLDAKDADLWTGEHVLLNHPDLQGVDGTQETQKVHINQVKELIPGHLYQYKGRAKIYDEQGRFFFIASNTVGDYDTATDTEKLENGFLSDEGLSFPDGGSYYQITG